MPAFIGMLVGFLGRMLLSVVGELLIKALVGAGVGLVAYKFGVAPVKDYIASRFSAAGPMVDYVGFLGIDVAVTMVLSALAGRAAVDSTKAFFTKRAK